MMSSAEELDYELQKWGQVVHMSDPDKLRAAGQDLAQAASQYLDQKRRRTLRGFVRSFIR